MNNNINISDLEGIAILQQIGGDTLLCTGELAQETVFADFAKASPVGLGIKVSNAKFQKAVNKQHKTSNCRFEKQLVKVVNPEMFSGHLSGKTIMEITGKKSIYKNGKIIPPMLTVEEILFCNCAEWALSSFFTLKNVSVVIHLNNGETFFKKF